MNQKGLFLLLIFLTCSKGTDDSHSHARHDQDIYFSHIHDSNSKDMQILGAQITEVIAGMLERNARPARAETMGVVERPKMELKEVKNETQSKDPTVPRRNDCVTGEVHLFEKGDFGKLEVIGQFNNGFILAELKSQKSEYFIIDQHAADERFNLETMVGSRKISKQTLVNPIKLDFSTDDAILLPVYSKSLETFGFSLNYDANLKCHYLVTIPSDLAAVGFGIHDFVEVFDSIKSGSSDQLQCEKLRQYYASQACRSSVMIGDVLTHQEMKKILHKLSTLKNPWMCAHGRPTIQRIKL
jgi:DNA mismatch repair ATPase MutL